MCVCVCVCVCVVSGVKRVPSEVLVSPVVKKRRVHSSPASEEREEEQEQEQEREDDEKVLHNQLNLFDGFSFLLTQRTKEDRHLGETSLSLFYMYLYMNVHCVCTVATPPNEQVDKELVSSQIRSRMGHVLENADQTVSQLTILLYMYILHQCTCHVMSCDVM